MTDDVAMQHIQRAERQRDEALERIAELERELAVMRRLLWQYHGHTGLYGDDGEMQCGICLVDFKRNTPIEIEAAFCRRSLAAVDAARGKPAP